jgi:hypothetical protein
LKALRWIVESAGKIPPEVWQAFVTIMGMLVLNWVYGDSIAMLW